MSSSAWPGLAPVPVSLLISSVSLVVWNVTGSPISAARSRMTSGQLRSSGAVRSWCWPRVAGSSRMRTQTSVTSRWSASPAFPVSASPVQVLLARISGPAASRLAEKIAGRTVA